MDARLTSCVTGRARRTPRRRPTARDRCSTPWCAAPVPRHERHEVRASGGQRLRRPVRHELVGVAVDQQHRQPQLARPADPVEAAQVERLLEPDHAGVPGGGASSRDPAGPPAPARGWRASGARARRASRPPVRPAPPRRRGRAASNAWRPAARSHRPSTSPTSTTRCAPRATAHSSAALDVAATRGRRGGSARPGRPGRRRRCGTTAPAPAARARCSGGTARRHSSRVAPRPCTSTAHVPEPASSPSASAGTCHAGIGPSSESISTSSCARPRLCARRPGVEVLVPAGRAGAQLAVLDGQHLAHHDVVVREDHPARAARDPRGRPTTGRTGRRPPCRRCARGSPWAGSTARSTSSTRTSSGLTRSGVTTRRVKYAATAVASTAPVATAPPATPATWRPVRRLGRWRRS